MTGREENIKLCLHGERGSAIKSKKALEVKEENEEALQRVTIPSSWQGVRGAAKLTSFEYRRLPCRKAQSKKGIGSCDCRRTPRETHFQNGGMLLLEGGVRYYGKGKKGMTVGKKEKITLGLARKRTPGRPRCTKKGADWIRGNRKKGKDKAER